MPSRHWEFLDLRPRDPQGPGGHYFFSNKALGAFLFEYSTRSHWVLRLVDGDCIRPKDFLDPNAKSVNLDTQREAPTPMGLRCSRK